MPMTSEEVAAIFPEMVKRFMPEKAQGVDATLQFDLTGDNGGQYWIRINDGKCESGQGRAENPKMTLKATADDWAAVINGALNPIQAFMSGKIKIQGDTGMALKLQSMFATG
jgi:putative sterol carrier protein